MYFTANPNGEAEIIKVTYDPDPKKKKLFEDVDFSEIEIRGRGIRGKRLSTRNIHRISLKSHGHSTLGGRKVWFDPDIKRLNYDDHGRYLGEFNDDDNILVILDNGDFYLTNIDINNHYEDNILRIEKYASDKVWTAVLFDAEQKGLPYLKRFPIDANKKKQNLMGSNANSQLLLLTDTVYPLIKVTFTGDESFRDAMEVDAETFIGVKSFKARGKRLWTTDQVTVEELEPVRMPEPKEDTEDAPEDDITEEAEEESTEETQESETQEQDSLEPLVEEDSEESEELSSEKIEETAEKLEPEPVTLVINPVEPESEPVELVINPIVEPADESQASSEESQAPQPHAADKRRHRKNEESAAQLSLFPDDEI